MVKRAAPSTAPAPTAKKAKAAKASPKAAKVTRATTKAAATKASPSKLAAAGAALKSVGKKAVAEVAEAVDMAGKVLLDDVADKPAKKSKAPKAAKKVEVEAEDNTTVGAIKKAGTRAAAKITAAVDAAGDVLLDDVATPDEDKPRSKKRKTAEEFMEPAPKAASKGKKAGKDTVDKKAVKAAAEPKKAAKAKETETKTKAAKTKATKAKAPKQPSPEVEAEASESESFIGAFETDSEGGADSSDDESDAEDAAVARAGQQVQASTLPRPKDDKSVAAALKRAAKKKDTSRGTIFVSRIPHGFYEEQMREYFGQFGDVTRLRLARNPKTGASRHYAYVEFASAPVAEIVADTMHNYLLMGHLLQCGVIAPDDIHPELWVGANKKFRKVPRARLEKVRQDKPRTADQQARANAAVLARQEARRQKIKAAGIDYEFDGHQ